MFVMGLMYPVSVTSTQLSTNRSITTGKTTRKPPKKVVLRNNLNLSILKTREKIHIKNKVLKGE
jgi:hypothetical protein